MMEIISKITTTIYIWWETCFR